MDLSELVVSTRMVSNLDQEEFTCVSQDNPAVNPQLSCVAVSDSESEACPLSHFCRTNSAKEELYVPIDVHHVHVTVITTSSMPCIWNPIHYFCQQFSVRESLSLISKFPLCLSKFLLNWLGSELYEPSR